MSNETIESATPAHVVEPPKQKHKSAAKAKAAKKPGVAKKSKPKTERANKKVEVIALLTRPNPGRDHESHWHTVRGSVTVRDAGRLILSPAL